MSSTPSAEGPWLVPGTQEGRAVRCEWRSVGTVDEKEIEFVPPEGWYVDEVLPAFSDNGAGVVFVMRRA